MGLEMNTRRASQAGVHKGGVGGYTGKHSSVWLLPSFLAILGLVCVPLSLQHPEPLNLNVTRLSSGTLFLKYT